MNHASTRSLQDVEVSALDHGIALGHTGTTGFMQDFKLPARSDDLTGAVRIHALDLIVSPEVTKGRGSVPKVLGRHGTKLRQGGLQVLQDKSISSTGQRFHGGGDNVITGEKLHEFRRVTARFESTFILLMISHLTSHAGIVVRIRRFVIQHVLKAQSILFSIPALSHLLSLLPVRDRRRRRRAAGIPWGNIGGLRSAPHDEFPWGHNDGGRQRRP